MAISASSKILASDVTNALGKKIDTAGTGLSKSGTTLALATVVTAGTVGGTSGATLNFSSTFTTPYVTYDAYGRITGGGTRTLTLPAAPTSVSKATTVPNFTAVTNNSATLPSGGTWRCIRIIFSDSRITMTDMAGGKSYNAPAFAIRIA